VQLAIDILENDLIDKYPEILETLLKDQTTQKNIFWATNNYEHFGDSYKFDSEILPNLITGEKDNIIMPRVHKDKVLQLSRSKEMAEVFTPSWICNAQNNLVDNSWFGRECVFNKEIILENGAKYWESTKEKIAFPNGKTWQDYVLDTRLEITCGEAPYLVSRYDTTTGEFINVDNRIGLLDRKLRVVNENTDTRTEWIENVEIAYKCIYGFEWQGDSLLLAREALLVTFIENFNQKFSSEPSIEEIRNIAEIISWNIWQMDGLKGVIPRSCGGVTITDMDLFGNVKTENSFCRGCLDNNIQRHNGTYCLIKDWFSNNLIPAKTIRFIDLLKK
jgi:hypothetical protein